MLFCLFVLVYLYMYWQDKQATVCVCRCLFVYVLARQTSHCMCTYVCTPKEKSTKRQKMYCSAGGGARRQL